jgi:hypothetical protein
MDAESIRVITEAVVEIAKILGPAGIAAYVAYKAGAWQLQARLKELERGHVFSAAEKLFDYYRERERQIAKSHRSLNKDLGFLLGMAADSEPDDPTLKEVGKLYDLHMRMLPTYSRLTLRDMEKYALSSSEEATILKGYLSPQSGPASEAGWGDKVFYLLEAYGYLQLCNQMILEELSTNYMKAFAKA